MFWDLSVFVGEDASSCDHTGREFCADDGGNLVQGMGKQIGDDVAHVIRELFPAEKKKKKKKKPLRVTKVLGCRSQKHVQVQNHSRLCI
jgi:hypothetical protein